MIQQHMSVAAILSLALTCRTLHQLMFRSVAAISVADKEEFLQVLEKDNPDSYFCHHCVKLHKWQPCWFRFYKGHSEKSVIFGRRCFRSNWYLAELRYALPYAVARVVMNRHLYGAKHGMPSSKIEMREYRTQRHDGVQMRDSWQARIVDDQLLLCSDLTISHVRGDEIILRDFITHSGPHICAHCYHVSELVGSCTSRPPEDSLAHCDQVVRSCPFCMTDFCVDVGWHGISLGWTIRIVAYRNLGAVRSPLDPYWVLMTDNEDDSFALAMPRAMNPTPSRPPPGIVRHLWSKGDKSSLEVVGEWICDLPSDVSSSEGDFETRNLLEER